MNLLSSVCFIVDDDDSLYWCLLQLLNHKKTQKIIMQLDTLINKISFERLSLMNFEKGNTLTLGHYVLIFVTYLISMSTTSFETFEADFFKFLIFASVSSSSLFTLDPELPVV